MKRIIVLFSLLVFSFAGIQTATAQKLGYVNVDSVFMQMPDRAYAKKELQQFTKELENQLTTMNAELEKKYENYTQEAESLSSSVKNMKGRELQDLQTRIQSFQMSAQQDIQEKELELLQPIRDKVLKAVKDVGEEQGYMYIFDVSMLIYKSDKGENLTPEVKTKLGL